MEYGCKLSLCDLRDYRITEPAGASALPEEYICELRAPVKNQRSVSSCVAHAVSSILEYHANGKHKLSTNFIYGGQRTICGRGEGKGMYLRDACKIVKDYGDMLLEDCPGNDEVPKCYSIADEALNDESKVACSKVFRIVKYFSCSSIKDIQKAIYTYGPVLASYKWYDTFKVNKDGVLTGEQKGDHSHHAVMIYGYTPEGFWCQNSWGKSWGKDGRFFVPYEYKVSEARGFVDLDNDSETQDLIQPKRNAFLDLIYKILNCIINMFKKNK